MSVPTILRRVPAGGQKGRALVRQALREASRMGLNVMRVFAHTTDPNFPLQTAPGVYNEKVFKALDFVLVEVSRAHRVGEASRFRAKAWDRARLRNPTCPVLTSLYLPVRAPTRSAHVV